MKHDKIQLRILETEKYAGITLFYSSGVEEPFKGEYRIMIHSPRVAIKDLQLEISAAELTNKLLSAIHSGK